VTRIYLQIFLRKIDIRSCFCCSFSTSYSPPSIFLFPSFFSTVRKVAEKSITVAQPKNKEAEKKPAPASPPAKSAQLISTPAQKVRTDVHHVTSDMYRSCYPLSVFPPILTGRRQPKKQHGSHLLLENVTKPCYTRLLYKVRVRMMTSCDT
jgi:hypothetical protein